MNDGDDWHARRMTNEELLDASFSCIESLFSALLTLHQRHGTGIEDICCRAVTGSSSNGIVDPITVLAEFERRAEQDREDS